MRYHFKVHKEGKGFWAECLELDGCTTQGDSKEELFENMQESLNTYLEEPDDSSHLFPFPKKRIKKASSIVEVPVDPMVAFSYLVRYYRITNDLTQKEMADELDAGIYSYQRLERKSNPTLKTISKIKEIFPDFSIDLVFS